MEKRQVRTSRQYREAQERMPSTALVFSALFLAACLLVAGAWLWRSRGPGGGQEQATARGLFGPSLPPELKYEGRLESFWAEQLNDTSPRAQYQATVALANCGSQRSAKCARKLASFLGYGNIQGKWNVAAGLALARLGPEAYGEFRQALDDEDRRAYALFGLRHSKAAVLALKPELISLVRRSRPGPPGDSSTLDSGIALQVLSVAGAEAAEAIPVVEAWLDRCQGWEREDGEKALKAIRGS